MATKRGDPDYSDNVIDWLNRSLSEQDMECDESDGDVNNVNSLSNDVNNVNRLSNVNNVDEIIQESEDEESNTSDEDYVVNLSDVDLDGDSLLNDRSDVNNSVVTSANNDEIEESLESNASDSDSDDAWEDIEDTDDGPVSNFPLIIDEPGPVLPGTFDRESSPNEYFSLFFGEEVLQLLCDETNKWGNSRKQTAQNPKSRLKAWKNMTVVEAKALLGTVLNMGLNPRSDITDYYSVKWVSNMKFFGDVFSRDRFLLLFWSLHFCSENGAQRGAKIDNFVRIIKEKCKIFYNPGPKISVDESTILFKGRVVFRVYNPNKPTKFGLKVFVLSDSSNGYVYDFNPYYGKQNVLADPDLLKTTQTVTALCDSLVKDPQNPPSGQHIYVDRYYNSPQLAQELLNRRLYVTGTVMNNRRGMPKIKSKKSMKRGDLQAFRKGDMAVVCWKDKRPVTLISTKHKASKVHMTSVRNKNPSKPPTMKPNMVVDYTKHMGGVDRADHYISNYQFMRRTKKWYRKMFFWLLEVSTVNAYILYKSVQEKFEMRPMKHKEFREKLIEELVTEKVNQNLIGRKRPGRPPIEPKSKRLDGKLHLMGKAARGNRCVVCYKKKIRKETVYFCKTCPEQPTLHPEDCFEAYHTKEKYG